MTKQEIFDLMNSNLAFHLATVEGDQPRVRGMMLYKADESGIVFHTSSSKDLHKQIINNPKVELCFNDSKSGIQVRVSGELEIVEDINLKDEITEHPTRKFLKAWKENGTLQDFYNALVVYRLKNGIATTWSMETNFEPKNRISL